MRLRPCTPPEISPAAYSPASVWQPARRSRGRRSGSAERDRCGSARAEDRCRPRDSAATCTGARSPHRRRRSGGSRAGPTAAPPESSARAPHRTRARLPPNTTSRPPSSSTKRSPAALRSTRAVGARRLRDRVALQRRRPEAAVRVVLQRIHVARIAAGGKRDLGHLAGSTGGVGREGPEPPCLGIAAAPAASTIAPASTREPPSPSRPRASRASPTAWCRARAAGRGRAFRCGRPSRRPRAAPWRSRGRCDHRPGATASASPRRSGRAGSGRRRRA